MYARKTKFVSKMSNCLEVAYKRTCRALFPKERRSELPCGIFRGLVQCVSRTAVPIKACLQSTFFYESAISRIYFVLLGVGVIRDDRTIEKQYASFRLHIEVIEQFSFECLKKLAPLSQPIRSNSKTNRDLLQHIFPRLA